MRIALLTSSRADYGIYLPLLKQLRADSFFDLKIICFGTHLSANHGMTINSILNDGFEVYAKIETTPQGDAPYDISLSLGDTISKFAAFWNANSTAFDLIFALGDRYEMFAAVSASVPFNLPVAHLHGGETTLGAIDEAFRHSITSMSKIHFTSTEKHKQRVSEIRGSTHNVYNVGALSLDNLKEIQLPADDEFEQLFGFMLQSPLLVTFHPETVNFNENEKYVSELTAALAEVSDQIVITMPNADTAGNIVRKEILRFAAGRANVITVESLGTKGYFACLRACKMVIGNSSSGIIEAASFGKYVLNLGRRQQGRDAGDNVIHCEIDRSIILRRISELRAMPAWTGDNIYGNGNAAEKIIKILKYSGSDI